MKKPVVLPFKLLIYDIETELLLAWLFALGEQVVRHTQLVECADMFQIITISYKWYNDPTVYVIEGENAIEVFDKVARTADVIIGKNNFRFDDKRINTDRMLKGKKPFPQWAAISDDLESQLRRHFAFPSFSLDAISKHLGFGGKEKMEFSDWVSIAKLKLLNTFTGKFPSFKGNFLLKRAVENNFCQTLFKQPANVVLREGKIALAKMGKYNCKDVVDTESILTKVLPYIKLKHNAAAGVKHLMCVTCGNADIIPSRVITAGATKYQVFDCLVCSGNAGKCTFRWNASRNKVYGRMVK